MMKKIAKTMSKSHGHQSSHKTVKLVYHR
jgi:hypothetical protein